MTTPQHRRSASVDDKVETKRKIIRHRLDEIVAGVEIALRAEKLPSSIQITVPTRYSLVTIPGPSGVPPDEWSRMSAIVRGTLAQKCGVKGYRGRPLARAVANATTKAGYSADT